MFSEPYFLTQKLPVKQSNIIISFAWKGTAGSWLGIRYLSAKGLPVAETLWYTMKHVPAVVQTAQSVHVVHGELRWTLLQERLVFCCWEHCLIYQSSYELQLWLLRGYNPVLRISHRLVLHLSCLKYIHTVWCWQRIAKGNGQNPGAEAAAKLMSALLRFIWSIVGFYRAQF